MTLSKPTSIGGIDYAAEFLDGAMRGAFSIDADNNKTFVDPNNNSNLFNEIASDDAIIDSFDIYKNGTITGNASVEFADNDLLTSHYNQNVAKEKNKQFQELSFADAVAATTSDVYSPSMGQSPYSLTGSERAETLAYPYDLDRNQDHLKIVQYEYQRPAANATYASSPNASVRKGQPYGKYTGGVLLPMPKVSDSNGAEWGKSDLNVFGLGVAGLGGSVLKDIENDTVVGSTLFGDLASKIGIGGKGAFEDEDQEADRLRQNLLTGVPSDRFKPKDTALAGLGIATQELSKLAGVDISADEFLARSTGRILNPNAELLFQGPVLRDFGFKFLMVARSEAEAKMIRRIIRFFKIGSAPIHLGGPALLRTPNIFQLEYKAGSKTLDTVNRFNEMALRTITVDYAPDGFWSAYQDSHPVAVVMSLQFSELRPIYQREHEDPSLENSVGY